LHGDLSELVRRALRVGRRVRARGDVRAARSLGSIAVDAIIRELRSPDDATVLVLGAGEMGGLAARALAARVRRVIIANRDLGRAESLASHVAAEACALSDLDAALARADAVISAADTRGSWLTRERLSQRLARGRLVLFDIAVPRSVAADARDLHGLTYRTVDDVVDVAPAQSDVTSVMRICEAEADRYAAWRRERHAAPAIRALRERAEAIRRSRVQRALAKLGHLSDRDRRVVESLSAALVNELLHQPTVALRREPSRTEVALELFGGER
jgi:glutamyl-tRNA reductase